jgi:hypothetical protein
MMKQLALFDAPAPQAILSAPTRKVGRYATHLSKPAIIPPEVEVMSIPTKWRDLVAFVREELLPAHHEAVVTGDAAEQIRTSTLIRRCRSMGANFDALGEALKAKDGVIPLWGQPGRFTLTIAGCEADCTYDGLLGHGGVGTEMKGARFYTCTGFYHFKLVPPEGGFVATGGLSLTEWIVYMAEEKIGPNPDLYGDFQEVDDWYRQGNRIEGAA